MSRRNTREGKARRRAERERRRRSVTSGQGPQAVEVQVAPRPGGPGSGKSDEHGPVLRPDADAGLTVVEPGEADLDTGVVPGQFGGSYAGEAGLHAPLSV